MQYGRRRLVQCLLLLNNVLKAGKRFKLSNFSKAMETLSQKAARPTESLCRVYFRTIIRPLVSPEKTQFLDLMRHKLRHLLWMNTHMENA